MRTSIRRSSQNSSTQLLLPRTIIDVHLGYFLPPISNSNHFGYSGHRLGVHAVGARQRGRRGVPGKFLGHDADVALDGFVPCHFVAAVRGQAAKDGSHRAVGPVLHFVVRRAAANGGLQIFMFDDIRTRIAAAAGRTISPAVLVGSFNAVAIAAAIQMQRAIGAVNMFGDLRPVVVHVSALAEQPRTVAVLKFHGVMVENFAVVRSAGNLRTAHADGLHGMIALEPIHDIQVVNVLFDNVIAAQPHEEIPISHLVFHFGQLLAQIVLQLGPLVPPRPRAVPVSAGGNELPQRAVLILLKRLAVAELMVPLQADANRQRFALSDFVGRQNSPHAGGIGGDGLFHENVFAGFHRGRKMNGPKTRRRGQNDQVGIGGQSLLVGIEPGELPLLRHVDASTEFWFVLKAFLQLGELIVNVILKSVGHANQLGVAAFGRKSIFHRPTAATAAADERDFQRVIVGRRMSLPGNAQCCRQSTADHGDAGSFQKLSPRRLVRWLSVRCVGHISISIERKENVRELPAELCSPRAMLKLSISGRNANRNYVKYERFRSQNSLILFSQRPNEFAAGTFGIQTGVPNVLFFLCGGFVQRPGNSEADELSVGQIPHTLGQLWVLLFPILVGPAASGTTEGWGIVIPRSAANHVRIHGRGDRYRIDGCFVFELSVEIGNVLIQHPFVHVAVNIVQAPRVGFFLADFFVTAVAVIEIPGVLAKFFRVFTKRVGCVGAGAASVFPFGFGRQAVVAARLLAQPLAIHAGRVMGHADRREPILAHAERHIGIRLRGPCQSVGQFIVVVGLQIQNFAAINIQRVHEHFELVPRDLALTDPERIELHFMLRTFVGLVAEFAIGAAHQKLASGNGQHLEFDVGVPDRLGIRLHFAGLIGDEIGHIDRSRLRHCATSGQQPENHRRYFVEHITAQLRPMGSVNYGGHGFHDRLHQRNSSMNICSQKRFGKFCATLSWIFAIAICLGTNCATIASANEPVQQRYEFSEIHMGAPWKIVLYAADEATAKRGSGTAYQRIEQLNRVLSDYDPDSELSKLSDTAPSSQPIAVSEDLWHVLDFSQRLSKASGGAFDITVGPLTKLWRRARRTKEMPDADLLAEAREATDFRAVQLDPEKHTAQLLKPHMRLDAGGIGMGYGVDEALKVLKHEGIASALIDASGDIGVSNPPPGERGWQIAIEPPSGEGTPSRYVLLSNYAITTSGDAFQAVEIGGRRYSHIVDPRTGLGILGRSAVTVIAPDCITADSYTKPICVLGSEAGFKLIESVPGAAAYVERETDGESGNPRLEKFETKRFAEFLSTPNSLSTDAK